MYFSQIVVCCIDMLIVLCVSFNVFFALMCIFFPFIYTYLSPDVLFVSGDKSKAGIFY